jgi:hypothetical protein
MSRLLTTADCIAMLRCSPSTFRGHVHAGRIRRVVLTEGGPWRFDPAELDRFLREMQGGEVEAGTLSPAPVQA